eukprot:4506589-Amphidinium_carterae.1
MLVAACSLETEDLPPPLPNPKRFAVESWLSFEGHLIHFLCYLHVLNLLDASMRKVQLVHTMDNYLCEVRYPEDVVPGAVCLAEPWGSMLVLHS